MTRLRRSDLLAALAAVLEIRAIASIDEFPARVLALLRGLLGADAASYTEVDPSLGIPTWTFDPPDVLLPVALVAAAALVHPLVAHFARTGDVSARTISEFLRVRQFQRLPIYDTLFRPIAAKYQLATALVSPAPAIGTSGQGPTLPGPSSARAGAGPAAAAHALVDGGAMATTSAQVATSPGPPLTDAGPAPVGLGFMRTRSDFTERERDLLDHLRPHLVAAREDLRTRTLARERLRALERGLEERGRGVVLLRGELVEMASEHGLRLLERWFDSGPPLAPARGPLVLERDGARLIVQRVPDDPALVLLDEVRTAPDPARVRELGLTRRETEILELVAQGLSDAQVADKAVVSVRTVHKHLEHAYRKLGVTDRRRAAGILLDEDGAALH